MKRIIKAAAVFNNCQDWSTIGDKLQEISDYFAPAVTLEWDVFHTSHSLVPMSDYVNTEGQRLRGIEPGWYDREMARFCPGMDVVLLVLNSKDWGVRPGLQARGWRTDRTNGPVELHIGVDEHELAFYPQFGWRSGFYQFARHEMAHALYMIKGIPDNTHLHWDRAEFDLVLRELEMDEPPKETVVVGDIWGFIKRFLKLLEKPSLLDKWAQAIQRHEGWFPGSRSFRNNNPGNLKFTRYTATLGAFGKDDRNFCMFGDYESGLTALKTLLTDAATDQLLSYKGSMTLVEFYERYAPSEDDNNPRQYAEAVAKYIGVPVTTQIKNLV